MARSVGAPASTKSSHYSDPSLFTFGGLKSWFMYRNFVSQPHSLLSRMIAIAAISLAALSPTPKSPDNSWISGRIGFKSFQSVLHSFRLSITRMCQASPKLLSLAMAIAARSLAARSPTPKSPDNLGISGLIGFEFFQSVLHCFRLSITRMCQVSPKQPESNFLSQEITPCGFVTLSNSYFHRFRSNL